MQDAKERLKTLTSPSHSLPGVSSLGTKIPDPSQPLHIEHFDVSSDEDTWLDKDIIPIQPQTNQTTPVPSSGFPVKHIKNKNNPAVKRVMFRPKP